MSLASISRFLKDTLSSATTGQPSTKRLLVIGSGVTLMLCTLGISASIARAICLARPVDAGAVAALGVVAGPLAILAGASYRKPESGGTAATDPSGGTFLSKPESQP